MARDVRAYTKACALCQRARQYPGRADLGEPTVAYRAMDVVIIDLQGPIEGVFVVTLVDVATRFQWATTTRSKESAVVRDAVVRILQPYFGLPRVLIHDDGREFKGEFAAWATAMGVAQRVNVPYNPNARGIVERLHRVNLGTLRKMREQSRAAALSTLVDTMVAAYNAREIEAAGVSPHEAMFGRAPHNAAQRALAQPLGDAAAFDAHAVAAQAVVAAGA